MAARGFCMSLTIRHMAGSGFFLIYFLDVSGPLP